MGLDYSGSVYAEKVWGIKMECKNCGSRIYEGDRFCSRCGTRVVEETLSAETKSDVDGTVEPEAVEAAAEPEKREGVETAAEPEKREGVEAAAEPEKREGVETAAEPERPEGVETEAEPERPEAVGAAAEPERPEAVGAAKPIKPEAEKGIPISIPEEKPSRSPNRLKGMFRGRNAAFTPVKPEKWIPKVILAVFGVAVAALIVNSAKLVNAYHRNFSTPEEYYRWVEQKAIQKNAKTLAEYYVNYFVEYLHRYDSHTNGEIRLELGDAGRDMMERAGLEPWFEEGAFTFESTNKDSVAQSMLGLEIGGEKVFCVDAIMDLRDEAVYLGFPGLTKTYLGVDTGESGFAEEFESVFGMEPEEYLDTLEMLEVFYRECPDKKQMEALANRYLELLLNSIDDVKIRTGKTARAGSVSQTCTTLEIYLDKNDIQSMLTEFLEELQEDSEIESLLFQIYDLAEELNLDTGDYRDADEFYEGFQDGIDDILNDMDYYVTYHDEMEMTIYVDDKGQIIGRTMKFPNSWNEISLSYLNPHNGSRFGYKGSMTVDGEEMSVTGSGKDFGNKVNGSFAIKYEGDGILDIEVKDFDMSSLRKGYINGSFTVTSSSGTRRAANMRSVASYLSDMELIINISMNRSSEELSMELKEGRDLWGTLTISTKSDSGKKISVPSTRDAVFVENDNDFEEWWNTVEWDDVIKKMNKAGLPSDAIDAVEEFGEMSADEAMDELSELIWFLMYDLSDEIDGR